MTDEKGKSYLHPSKVDQNVSKDINFFNIFATLYPICNARTLPLLVEFIKEVLVPCKTFGNLVMSEYF